MHELLAYIATVSTAIPLLHGVCVYVGPQVRASACAS